MLKRNTGKEILLTYDGGNTSKIYEEQITYRKVGDHATNMPCTIRYGNFVNGNYVINESIKYGYDTLGNVNAVYENGELAIRYEYDYLNRLSREDNKILGKTTLFTYDNNGNILKRREFNFTLKDINYLEELDSTDFTYIYNGDKLISYNGESFAYDVIGNPTTYRGKTLTWAKGRQLTNFNGVTFAYNGKGQRISKNNIKYTYDSNGKLIYQTDGTNSLGYYYDATGVCGIRYNNKTFVLRKNAQGDITAIYNAYGEVLAKYVYNAFGVCTVIDTSGNIITDANNIANLNPFRYRGYYYDAETKLYYLKTRYYDAEIGRFITIDDISYLNPDVINGVNLYAYCNNNPIANIDPNGTNWWTNFWGGVGDWFSNVGNTIWAGLTTAVTAVGDFFSTYGAAIGAGALAILVLAGGIVGSIFTGGLAGAAILGAGIGFFGGVASNMAIQASNNGLANMDFGATMKSGGIGLLIGAASGAISFGFGTIGSFYGQMVGNALSSMTIAGLNVGSAFSYLGGASLFSTIGTGAGYLLGSFVGSALGNELMNNLFGYNPSSQENISEGITGLFMDFIIKLFKVLFGR